MAFFPEQFLSVEDFSESKYLSYPHQRVSIPGSVTLKEGVPTWGSVVLLIENFPANTGELGLKLRADSAYTFYWFHEKDSLWQRILEVGTPGQDKQSSTPLISDAIGRLYADAPGNYFFNRTHLGLSLYPGEYLDYSGN